MIGISHLYVTMPKMMKKRWYYAEGIRKAQRELGLEVDSIPNLWLYGTAEAGSGYARQDDSEETG
jgi:hypothetical protein